MFTTEDLPRDLLDQELYGKYMKEANVFEMLAKISEHNNDFTDRVRSIVALVASHTRPDRIVFIRGTAEEKRGIIRTLVEEGSLLQLNQKNYPDSYLYRSNPNDVARTEKDTYICTTGTKDDAGPTNNWMHTSEAYSRLFTLLRGSMSGKTMYVVPYWLGPLDSDNGMGGIEITDSLYVVANLNIITRSGIKAMDRMAKTNRMTVGIHSTMDLIPSNRYICHFPEENRGQGLIISLNSNYGGNALLSKKCHALRIATSMAKTEGWMAEHMMLIGLEEPSGRTTYISGAFPSSSGKTNLSMIEPPPEMASAGWKSWLISDDITWMHSGKGRLMGINPEYGFFGVAPHTSYRTNPNAMNSIRKNTIFTNVAVDGDMNPYWEGMDQKPQGIIDWLGKPYDGVGNAAHPNSRFTSPITQYPHLSTQYENGGGVPVSAFLYGGRRGDLIPLVYEAFSWEEGVLIGAMQRVETTAAAEGKVGVLRNDPMANRPFVGYNMADYFQHHLDMGKKLTSPPKIFNVNWFRKGNGGEFMWPGYGYNTYVLKWIAGRVNDEISNVVKTPIGYTPDPDTFDAGNVDREIVKQLLHVDSRGYLEELKATKPFLESFGNRFPEDLWKVYYNMKERLEQADS